MTQLPSALTAARRARDLERLADGWEPDVLVVGAGFTGAGIALDAAIRGLQVAVVDRADLAHGTSRWSSKLVHGGLRYLAAGNVRLAHESAVERGVLMDFVAPHLTRPLQFVTPLNGGMPASTGALAGAGYLAGNLLRLSARTRASSLPSPTFITPGRARCLAPGICTHKLWGAWLNTDGQLTDDARMVVAIARTAAAHGAAVLTYIAAVEVHRDRAILRDVRSGEQFEARAGRVVLATGAWTDVLDDRVRLRPSRGVHLVVDGATLGHPTAAVTAPVPGHMSRFVFALPQQDGRVYIGLTDDPAERPVPEESVVLDHERDELLAAINPVLDRDLTARDVIGGFAGYRPLVAGAEDDATADLSRDHVVIDDDDGPVTIVGGKLTTYRRMAADVVDRLTDRPCTTARQALVGAVPRHRLATLPFGPWLVGRYGAEAADVQGLIHRDHSLGTRVVPSLPYLQAELVFAIRREGALTASDLVDRRTRIGLVPADRDVALPVAQALLNRG